MKSWCVPHEMKEYERTAVASAGRIQSSPIPLFFDPVCEWFTGGGVGNDPISPKRESSPPVHLNPSSERNFMDPSNYPQLAPSRMLV